MKKNKILIISVLLLCLILIITILCLYFCMNNKELDLQKINNDILSLSLYKSSNLEDITISNVSDIFYIDKSYIKEVVGKIPMLNIDSNMYVIIKTEKKDVKYIKQKLEEYAINLEKQWKDYLESQYDLVLSRKIGVKSNYVYLIISNDNKQVLDLIK